MNSPSEVKARASKLRDVLTVMGHQLKLTESLEVISKMEGFPDWNTYTAQLTKKQQMAERYSDEKNTEIASPASDHPIIVAIKSDWVIFCQVSISQLADNSVCLP